MNKALLFIMLVVFGSLAFAAGDKVYILDLKYDKGSITLVNQTIQYGFYPDRIIQPEEGYKCEVIAKDGSLLYSFSFDAPLKENVDVSVPEKEELTGGLIVYDKQNFALVIPYFDDAKEIRFSDGGKDLLKVDVEEKAEGYRWLKMVIWIPIILAAFVYFILWGVKKKNL